MMDFTLSEEQRQLQEVARRFAREHVAPLAEMIEKDREPLSIE